METYKDSEYLKYTKEDVGQAEIDYYDLSKVNTSSGKKDKKAAVMCLGWVYPWTLHPPKDILRQVRHIFTLPLEGPWKANCTPLHGFKGCIMEVRREIEEYQWVQVHIRNEILCNMEIKDPWCCGKNGVEDILLGDVDEEEWNRIGKCTI